METLKNFEMSKDKVVQSPKDEILEGVIIEVNKTTWRNIIDPDKINKFEEPDKEIIQIKYEMPYNNRILKGEDTFAYYEAPMANSKLGMFLEKYNTLKSGIKVKLIFDKDGFGKIKVD